jgi:hypothetical protein
MDALGINSGLLLEQAVFVIALIGFAYHLLIDLRKKNLTGLCLPYGRLLFVPFRIGWLAYWIIRPTAENQ